MNSTLFYQEYARLRREIKKDIIIAYRSFIINSENNIKTNSNELWNFIRNKKKSTYRQMY